MLGSSSSSMKGELTSRSLWRSIKRWITWTQKNDLFGSKTSAPLLDHTPPSPLQPLPCCHTHSSSAQKKRSSLLFLGGLLQGETLNKAVSRYKSVFLLHCLLLQTGRSPSAWYVCSPYFWSRPSGGFYQGLNYLQRSLHVQKTNRIGDFNW